jgi:hypothetical protein
VVLFTTVTCPSSDAMMIAPFDSSVSACWEKRNELRKMRGKKMETFIAVIGFIVMT